MTFQQFLLILRARWLVGLAVLLVVVATTVAVSLVLPKQYSSATSVLIDVKSPDPILGVTLPALVTPGYMATQVDIVTSDRVAQRVVRMLGFDKSAAAVEQWREATEGKGSMDAYFADLLKKKLDVKPSRESNVLSIQFSGQDPAFSAAVANAFAQAYIDTNLELKIEPAKQYASWFAGQSKALREGLEKAQSKLSAFQQESGIVATDERLDIENARLAELSSQYTAIQAQRSDSSSRQAQVGQAQIETLPEVQQNSLIIGLKADLARGEARLNEMSQRYGRNHPEYQRAQGEVDTQRAKLDAEMKKVASTIGTSNRVNVQREAEVRAALNAQKNRVLELKKQRDDLAVLQREVESAQRAYDAVAQRFTQTSLESQTTQTNIVVLTPAIAPVEHSSPNLLLNTLVAIFLGTLLAVGTVLLLELLDQRVRGDDDLQQLLGVPVLGLISSVKFNKGAKRARAATA
ncbi:MAG: chain length determinant protein EpsF [Methyloversatilis sp.]|jgi:chain length determinant protein EpsF|uniref:Exopolysaccharide biosynthesis protein EpsF-like protein n=1 Tax=Methyloversatilis universalis (strain ATCC BAA-1314 / DSM 25237 / JCM 13912 / CCUG 52030 / FAM5) TaxID=1000565 RepID=F5R9I3_METUF|nr:chain length determinant protein EpsF [Methyloversatilis universalis]EGK73053.1 Putative exopolysaccharide biosynthesis protein EpsF-like protein [Methyloversatilis universalis FAM5]MCP4636843.1 chain length determinant protein EpsF [Methyloversatilis sp.]